MENHFRQDEPPNNSDLPARSYALANQELVLSYERYLKGRRRSSPRTIAAYRNETLKFLLEFMGSRSLAEADRIVLMEFLASRKELGSGTSTLERHRYALRSFFKFLQLAALAKDNPALRLGRRKILHRLPRILSVQEIEALIAATKTPLERAVVEVLYATGVRVSELVNIRIENIDFDGRTIKIVNGKGGKDRYVLFGHPAAEAMRSYVDSRPSRTCFLFEAAAYEGYICKIADRWYAYSYVNGTQRCIAAIGSCRDFPTKASAKQELERIADSVPGYCVTPSRPYTRRAIHLMLSKIALRAGVERVHPHALRRAAATHMLVSGADIRAVQEFLGHAAISNTQLYTHLTAADVKAVYDKAHPHAKGDSNGEAQK